MLPRTRTTTNSEGHAIIMRNMQHKKCRSCKYSQNLESMRIYVWNIFFVSLLVNKEIEGECCIVLEPP